MSSHRPAAGALIGLAWMLAPPGVAQEAAPAPPPTPQAHFDALVVEIEGLRADLRNLDQRERGLLYEMDRLEMESALRSRELARLSGLKQDAAGELAQARLRLTAHKEAVAQEEAGLAKEIRAVYQAGRSRDLSLLLSAKTPVDVLRGIAYLDVMAHRRSEALSSLRRRRAGIETMERSLVAQTQALDQLSAQSAAKADELARVRHEAARMLESTRQDSGTRRSAIGELTRAAQELESAIVAEIQGRATGDGGKHEADADRIAIPKVDVSKMRGALSWPVPGVIAVGFGKMRHPRFGTVTPRTGVEIETSPGEPIRAVLGGRVVFARRFSGYGNTVLLDHGNGYLSVYARAAVTHVAEGEEVLPGQALGVAADHAMDGGAPTVYFELRSDGRAVDPTVWLKRKTTARREED